MTKYADHDSYIASAPEPLQPLLMRVRAQLTKSLPDAEEVIRYDMPGFGIAGSVIAGYAAFSKQCGLYVAKGAISSKANEIAAAGLKASKTGVTFSLDRPISDELIASLAEASRTELGA